jgi:hypothetical protein
MGSSSNSAKPPFFRGTMKYSTVRLPPLSSREEKPRNINSLSLISLERAEANFPLHALCVGGHNLGGHVDPLCVWAAHNYSHASKRAGRPPICSVWSIFDRGPRKSKYSVHSDSGGLEICSMCQTVNHGRSLSRGLSFGRTMGN